MTSISFPLCFASPPPFWFQSFRNYPSQQCFGYKNFGSHGGIFKVLTVAREEMVINTGSVVGYREGSSCFHSSRIQSFRLDTEREGTGIFWPFPSVGNMPFWRPALYFPYESDIGRLEWFSCLHHNGLVWVGCQRAQNHRLFRISGWAAS